MITPKRLTPEELRETLDMIANLGVQSALEDPIAAVEDELKHAELQRGEYRNLAHDKIIEADRLRLALVRIERRTRDLIMVAQRALEEKPK